MALIKPAQRSVQAVRISSVLAANALGRAVNTSNMLASTVGFEFAGDRWELSIGDDGLEKWTNREDGSVHPLPDLGPASPTMAGV
jgi:hypothetical protein